jgi:GT2 family glycosyltransferase/glycosyltransferase involved in cell wall biosynthesis
MVRFLRDDGWSVTFLAEGRAGDGWHAQRLRELGVATFAGYEHAQSVVARGRFDLAVIAFWEPAERLIPVLRTESPETRILLDSHDLWFLREARRLFGVEGQLDAMYGASVARELNTYELADGLLTVSVNESRWLNDLLGPGRAEYLPMEEPPSCSAMSFDDRRGALFVGNFRHLPNGDAVEYLCRDIVPLIEPRLMATHPLSIVGNHLDEKIRAYSKNLRNVHMIGWVPSVLPYVERARVCVVPLLYGAGVKGKVLQALMLGTPVVTTSIGAEGLDLSNEVHAIIADRPGDIANGISRLLVEPETWMRLSEGGRRHVVDVHDEGAVRKRFLAVVEDLLTRPTDNRELPEAFRHSRRRYQAYRRTISAVKNVVREVTDPGDAVLVITKGDDSLLALDGRAACHFPQAPDGRWAGYHPANSVDAIAELENQRARGARYLVLPESAFWWLHHYDDFATHLEVSFLRVHADETVIVYDLSLGPTEVVPGSTSEKPGVTVVGTYGQGQEGPPKAQVAALEATRRYTVTQRWFPVVGASGELDVDLKGSAEADDDWIVYVNESAVIGPGFLDDFLALSDRLGAGRAQPPHTNGPTAGPPITERLHGCVARRISAPTTLPVMAVRPKLLIEGEVLLTDAVPIGLAHDLPGGGAACDPPSTKDVIVHGPAGPVSAVQHHGSGPSPAITVVIATYDRPQLLATCLDGFCSQTVDKELFEVVVIDDGSPGGDTGAVVGAFADRLRLCHLRIEHAGRSAAKNVGVFLASGDLLLFFDDDDRPQVRLLEEHLLAHREQPAPNVAILGHTEWAPELSVTPFMYFLTDVDRLLFSYPSLTEGTSLTWQCFWEGRISCKRSFLMRHGLHDQRLAYSIDVELGWRLARHGLDVRYWPGARSYMTREVSLEDFCARTEGKARSQAAMATIHPDPEVQRYARVTDADSRWDSARPRLAETIDRARTLESQFSTGWRLSDPRMDELFSCFRVILDAHKAKGACDGRGSTKSEPKVSRATRRTDQGRAGQGDRGARTPELTVTIPVWSRTAELAEMAVRTVDRIWAVSRIPTEVVLIDNGSPHQRRFRATVHRFPENRGVSAAWNAGIARAQAPVVAVLNSDCTVEAGWDEALHEAATTGRRIAFPYTDHGDGRGFRRPDQGGTSGWCFALSILLFQEIGVFDERFSPAFCEDTDYWHRAWEMDVELSPVPAARVTHVRRATTGLDAHVDWLLQGHRYKYGWKHGVDPHRAPPYYNRQIIDYEYRGRAGLMSWGQARPGLSEGSRWPLATDQRTPAPMDGLHG